MSQILAHLHYLDEATSDLSTRIEDVIGPFADEVAHLDTIPGINRRTAEVIIAELGPKENAMSVNTEHGTQTTDETPAGAGAFECCGRVT